MAETPEGKVKRWLKAKLKLHFPGAYVYWPPGSMFGRTGAPDCFFVWRGVFVAIEVKAEGNKPTAIQLKHLRDIIGAGGIGAVLTGRDESRFAAIHRSILDKAERYESDSSVR